MSISHHRCSCLTSCPEKYLVQTKEQVEHRQKIPIISMIFWLWLLSWKYKLKTCGKMYFKKLVRLQIFYIHKFLFYVILCHRVHIWWPSILFQSCHGKRSGYMHASHTTLFEISSHDNWFWWGRMTSTCRNLENIIVYLIYLLAIKNKQQERLMFSFYFVLYNVTLVGYSL